MHLRQATAMWRYGQDINAYPAVLNELPGETSAIKV